MAEKFISGILHNLVIRWIDTAGCSPCSVNPQHNTYSIVQ